MEIINNNCEIKQHSLNVLINKWELFCRLLPKREGSSWSSWKLNTIFLLTARVEYNRSHGDSYEKAAQKKYI